MHIFKLFIAHAVADFALQSDWMAKNKNPNYSGYDSTITIWPYVLISHALIHVGAVWIVTGDVFIALIELFAHFTIDYLKCYGLISFHQDQMLHIACKIIYGVAL